MRQIIRIFTFLAGFAVLLALISPFFRGGDLYEKKYVAYRDGRIAGIEVEEPGRIDVINVGDSLANVGIAPMELFQDYGITAYTMGRDEQKTAETYYAIRQAMKTQNVKVILWEAHNISKHQKGMEPYYPVNDEKNAQRFQQYKALAAQQPQVIFGGRLGEYKYYDMDQVIASALGKAKEELGKLL